MSLNFYTKATATMVSLRKSLVFFLVATFLFVNNSQAQTGASALTFDATNTILNPRDYVNIPVKPDLNISAAITIETWIKPTKSSGVQDVICKSTSTESTGYVFPRLNGGLNGLTSMDFLIFINGIGWQTVSVPYTNATKLNQWHHVAATYDGYIMKVYIDGTLQTNTTSVIGEILVNNNPLTLGMQPGFTNLNFGGSLDETRIWNRALSQCEIAAAMNCQLAGNESGLVAYYRYNQGILNVANPLETTLHDSSPTGADGTLENFGLLGLSLLSDWSVGKVSTTSSCTVVTPPTVTAASLSAYIALGGTINLTATTSATGATFSWTGPNGFTSNQQNPVINNATLSATGTYTVTASLNGCQGSSNTVVTVAPKASGLNFDGADDIVVIPNSPQFNTNEFSIEAWIYPTGSATVIQNVASKSSNSDNTGYKFPKTQDNWSSFAFELNINHSWITLTAPIPGTGINRWNHVAATFDGYFMRIYLNGALVAVQEVNGTVTMNSNPLTLGNQQGRAEYYKGKVDELRFWNRAVSQCEIINNMQTCELNGANNGIANQTALGAYYRFNQGLENSVNTWTTLNDSSGHGNNGTLNNFALSGTTSNWSDGKVNSICATYVLPLLTASANGSVFQTGTTVKLFAVNGNNNTYSWAGPNSFSTTTQNPQITNVQTNATGIYTVTTPYVNCVVTSSKRITVTNQPQITASGPTTICPSGSVVLSSANTGTSYQWYLDDILINTATSRSFTATQAGTYTVVVTNGLDVTISAGLTVTIVPDVTAPVPNVTNLPTLNLVSPATVTSIPTATDNCRGTVNGTSNIPLTFNHSGNYTIIWSYNDNNGNISTQTQNVVVTKPVDVTPPVIAGMPDINANASVTTSCGAVVNFTATATDEAEDPIVTITYSPMPGSIFPVGRTTVTVTATDGSNNSAMTTFFVFVAPTTVAPITGNTNLCVRSTTTFATTSTGGVWSSDDVHIATVNASTGVVTGVRGGTANIIYTNACGAIAYLNVTVRDLPSAPNVNVDNNCGSSTLTASNFTGTLLWSTGATTTSIVVNNSAAYSVTQTVNGCTSDPETQTTNPKALPATPIVTVVNNCGSSTLTVSNPQGNVLWSNGSTANFITVSNSATYTVTNRANGCTSVPGSGVSAPKATPAAPTVTVSNDCGTSTLTASNTTGTILWSNNATTPSITVSNSATYTVTQNVSGCVSAAGTGTSAPKVIPTAPTVTVVNNCGSSILTASNTTGSILWSTGETTSSITVANSATYTVTQTVNGCESAAGSGVSAPKAIPSAPLVTVFNNCGSSNLTASNVTGSILWSNNATTPSITVTNGATYTVTQTVNGCVSGASSGVSAPKAIPSAPIVTVANNCGSSTLTASNTTGSLLWNINETTASITVYTNDDFSVTQTVNGCVSVPGNATSAPKTVPSVPTVTVADNCGSSTLTAADFTGSLLWSNNATTTSITVSNTAVYSVAQIVNGCMSASRTAVSAPKAIPTAPVVTVVDNCGSSTLTASNTTGSILWSNNATTPSITVTNAATYTVTQTVNGCVSAAGSGVSAPKAIPTAPVVTVADNCGSSTLTASNTTGSILWSNNATTPSITVTNAATYTVTQTVNGCVSVAGAGTSTPKAVPSTPVVTVVDNCGSSLLTASNITGTILWSNNATTPSITVTNGAIYTVTQTVDGCISAAAAGTSAPKAIPTAPVVTVADNCGSSTLTASNTTGSILWSNNATTPSITVTDNATYTVTQTVNGCVSAAGSGVSAPKAIPTAPVVTVADNCGSSTLTASNTTGSILWSNNATSASITVSNAATYTVTQTVNGCVSAAGSGTSAPKTILAAPVVTVVDNCGSSTLTASNTTGSILWSNNATTPSITVTNGATYTVTQTVNGCESAPGSGVSAPKAIPSAPVVTVADNCGSSVLTASNTTGSILWSNNAITPSITVTNAATYTVTQTVNGCVSAAGSGTSAPKAVPSAPVVTVVDNCGSSTLTASNTTGSILWSNNATTPSITVTNGATYTVTQTVNGCVSAAGSGVSAPKAMPSAPVVTVADNCGSSVLTASNTTGSILWSNNAITPSITVTNAATYTVTQTVNGCVSAAGSGTSAPKAIPSAPVVTVADNCGSSVLTASNTTGSILWSNNAITPSITVTNAATYTVTQTVNGCVSAAGSGTSAPKAVPSAPVVTVVDNCGSSTLTASNTTGSILWSNNATTPSITVTNGATYTVTQTVNGCVSAAGSGVSAPKAIPAAPTVTVANNCGSSILTASNATGSILWSNGAASASITVSNGATYTVTQTVNGCVSAAGSGVSAPKAIPSAPVVTVADNCGSSVLTASNTTGSILWSNGANSASITVSNGATYTVTQTVNGCVSAAGSGVSAPKAIPSAPVVTVADNCGSSVLTASNATGSILWSNGATSASITVSNGATYTVTQTVNGCVSAAGSGVSAPKAIPSTPVVTVVDNCGSSTLTASNTTGSILWSNNATTPSITVTNAATFTVTQTANGCVSAAGSGTSAPKAVQATPVVTVTNNCGSTTLSTNATGTLAWSNGATTSSFTITTPGSFSVTATNTSGCSATSAVTAATVNTNPVVAGITGTTTVTAGSTTQLADATSGGAWSSNSANATVNASGLVTGVTAGTATISYTVTSGAGCSTTVTTVVTVNALPTCTTPVINVIANVSANTTATQCSAPVTYTATVSGTPTPALTYTFSGATTASGTGTGSGATFNLGTTTVVIKATNSCGYVTRSFTVTVNDATAPIAIARNITVALDADGSVIVTPAQVNNGSYDNCSAVTLAFRTNTTSTTTTGTIYGTADENGNLQLTAPSGAVITAINFASYGTPNGSAGNFTLGGCNAAGSKTIVEGYALGRNSATIPATNDVFGDPCFGTYKRLYVLATYQLTTTGGAGNVSSLTFDCSKKGANTVTLSVTDANGNTSTQTAIVTVVDNTAPVITAVANQTFCGTSGSYTVPALSATDNCAVTTVTYAVTGATSRTGTGYNASGTFNTGTSTITWTVKDASNNTSTSSTTVVVGAGPIATIAANSAAADFCNELTLNGSSSVSNASYKWMSGSTIVGTSQQLSLGQGSAEGTYQLYVTANGCTSAAASYSFSKQNLLSSYTILAYDDVMIGKYSKVATGSVGVMLSGGNARFYSNTSVNGPNSFVKSPDIDLNGSNINISRQIIGLASVSLPTMQYNTSSASSYSSYSTAQYSNVTLSSNYKNLTIRKGSYATLSGTVFGTIELEEGASVRFTNSTINIEKLLVDDGARDGYYSYVRFAPNTSVRVSSEVSIGSQVLVNPDNYRVTFYMGDNSNDEEHFTVKGADTKFIGNIYMPKGKLMVTSTDDNNDSHENCNHQAHSWWNCGHYNHNHHDCDHKAHSASDCSDDVYMTGTFIVDDVESKGNTVIWNSYVCGSASVPVVVNSKPAAANTVALTATQEKAVTASTEEDLKITVMPNPSTTYFTLKFESKYETPINMRVMDLNGRVVDAQSKIGANSTIRIGAGYASGTYYAEMIQGGTRKVIQLLKIK
ncbi:MAG: LamG-like jellyroll fold domain-containing protein [Bacteroidota bacterium]